MDASGSAQKLLLASLLAAVWCASLELASFAVRPGVPPAALGILSAATFALCAPYLTIAALALLALAQIAALGRLAGAVCARPRLRYALAAVALVLSIALHVANALFYVRLYATIHAALALLTLLAALLGFALLVGAGQVAAAPARRAPRRIALTLLAGFCGWLAIAAAAIAAVVSDEALRAHALEQSTLLDDALLAFDRVSGILAPSAVNEAQTRLDPQLLAAVQPRALDAASGLLRGANVLLVTIDSMRFDRWSVGNPRAPLLPAIEALAADGIRFARAYAPSCWTIHSMSATLWGRLPSQLRFDHVGVLSGLRFAVFSDDDAIVNDPRRFKQVTPVPARGQGPNLVDLLRGAGYETATVAAYIYYFRAAGLTASFEHVDEDAFRELGVGASGIAPVPMVQRATRLLDQRDPARPFFLWLHFMEPHAPYEARDAAAQGGGAETRYDSELRYVDGQIAALRTELEKRGLDDSTLWVVHADHGEEFGDHGGGFHATTLYEETVRVPLMLRLPRASAAPAASAQIDTPVSLLDLAPTLLDLLGITSELPLGGRSVANALRGAALPERPLLMECDRFNARKRAYLRWPFKLIVDHATGTTQLYALTRDPLERDNLASREPALRALLAGELLQIERALAP